MNASQSVIDRTQRCRPTPLCTSHICHTLLNMTILATDAIATDAPCHEGPAVPSLTGIDRSSDDRAAFEFGAMT